MKVSKKPGDITILCPSWKMYINIKNRRIHLILIIAYTLCTSYIVEWYVSSLLINERIFMLNYIYVHIHNAYLQCFLR